MRRINHFWACIQKNSLQRGCHRFFPDFFSISIRMLLDHEIPHYSCELHPILQYIAMHLHCIDLFFLLLLMLPLLLFLTNSSLFLFCTVRHLCGTFFCSFQQYIITFCPKQNWLLFCHNDNAFTTYFDWHVAHLLFVCTHTHSAILNEITKP